MLLYICTWAVSPVESNEASVSVGTSAKRLFFSDNDRRLFGSLNLVHNMMQVIARPCDATRCDVMWLSLRIDFFYSEQCCMTCRSRRRCHAELYCHASTFWHGVTSRHGALRRLASYCELCFRLSSSGTEGLCSNLGLTRFSSRRWLKLASTLWWFWKNAVTLRNSMFCACAVWLWRR